LAWWLVALRWLVGLWLLAMDSRWLDLLDLRLRTEVKRFYDEPPLERPNQDKMSRNAGFWHLADIGLSHHEV
jgi:hypothetical protein